MDSQRHLRGERSSIHFVLRVNPERREARRASGFVQLGAGADFGPPSDTLTYTFLAWAEAAQLETLAGQNDGPVYRKLQPMFLAIGQWTAGFAGLLLLYLAWALYPGEKREVRNKLEDWWYQLSLTGERATTGHSRFLRAVAKLVEGPLHRLTASPRTAAWHSLFIAATAVHLVALLVALRWWNPICVVASVLAALLPFMSRLNPLLLFTLRWVAILCLLPFTMLIATGMTANWWWPAALLVLIFGAIVYYVAIRLTHQLLYLSQRPMSVLSATQAVGTVAALLAVGAFPFLGLSPLLRFLVHHHISSAATAMWYLALPLMMITVLASWPLVLFIVAGAGLLVHRVIWTVGERSIYALWEYGVLTNRALLTGFAISLFALAGWSWAIKVVGHFAK